MKKTNYEVAEVIFDKCPICNKGKIQKLQPKGFFSFAKSEIMICDKCDAIFSEDGEKEGETLFKLDLSKSNQKSQYDGESLKVSEWERGISDLDWCIKNNKLLTLTVDGLNIILQEGEQSHWYSATQLMEERAIRRTYGGAVRVMKGVYVGGRQGESHGELRTIDNGTLLLTNQRLIFNGGFKNREYQLDKVVSVKEYGDAFEIGATNRQKVQIFKVDEPHKWAEYIKIAIKKYEGKGKSKNKSTSLLKKEPEPGIEKTEKRDLDSLFNEAKELVKDHRYKEAEIKFRQAIAIKKYGYLYCGLGDLYYKLEKYDEAIKTYKEALKVEPDIPYPKRAIEKIERKLTKLKKK